MLICEDSGRTAISAAVPEGPCSGHKALPPTIVISPPPTEGFGSRVVAGERSDILRESSVKKAVPDLFIPSPNKKARRGKVAPLAKKGAVSKIKDAPPTKSLNNKAFLAFSPKNGLTIGERPFWLESNKVISWNLREFGQKT